MRKQPRTIGLQAVGLILALCFPPLSHACFGQAEAMPSPQHSREANHAKKKLYAIEVEDAIEAGLIEQQLKIKPELLRGHTFFYYGDETANASLRRFGYSPVPVEEDLVLTQVVRVARKGNAQAIRELGVTIVLAERTTWVVRASPRQIRLLGRLGYRVIPLGRNEPRPRQVRLTVSTPEQVAEIGALRVDIYGVERIKEGYIVGGGAFDDAIGELRKRGFKVEILPDPPGVRR